MADLSKIDFSPSSGVRSLQVEGNDAISNVMGDFKATENISFLAP